MPRFGVATRGMAAPETAALNWALVVGEQIVKRGE